MEEAKISSKGQVVIPKYMRDALGLKEGTQIIMYKHDDKLIILKKPQDPLDSLNHAGSSLAMKNIRRDIKPE